MHAFVGDGGLAPWMLQRQAARVGLDVIAITNHNQTLAGHIGRWAARRSSGPMVIVGEEITGRDFHLIAVGIQQAVDWDQPADAAIDQVHAQGGVAIAAHPMHGFAEGYDERALAQLDGLEAAHPDAAAVHAHAAVRGVLPAHAGAQSGGGGDWLIGLPHERRRWGGAARTCWRESAAKQRH